jgi:alpha-beta hydrolase superfamily lysophospholipase
VPTLLLYAGDDHLVSPAGSRAFAAVAGASAQVQPGILSAQVFESLYHEIFNEAPNAAAPVLAALKTWLDARF